MIRVRKIDHVAVQVDDVAVTGAFYTDVLGLKEVPLPVPANPAAAQAFMTELQARTGSSGPSGGMWVQAGPSQIHMTRAEHTRNRANPFGAHIAFEVEDFEGAKADLNRRGLSYVEAPSGPPFRQLWLLDPSGNTVELWSGG